MPTRHPHHRLSLRSSRMIADALETRLLFDTTIAGTANADAIIITTNASNDYVVTLNGVNQPVAAGAGLIVNAGGGADTIELRKAYRNVTINGGAGNDAVTVGGGNIQANINVFISIAIDGGADTDQLNFDSSADSDGVGDVMTFTDGLFVMGYNQPLGNRVSFSTFENYTLRGGPNDDTFRVRGTVLDTHVSVFGGAGNDSYLPDDYTSTATAANVNQFTYDFKGGITFDGGTSASTGGDRVILNDTAGTDANPFYQLDSDSLNPAVDTFRNSDASMQPFRMVNVESLTFTAPNNNQNLTSIGRNKINVARVTINGGSANDLFDLSDMSTALGNGTRVTINGGGGADSFTGDDIFVDGNQSYSLSGNTLAISAAGTNAASLITLNTVGDFSLSDASGSNQINIGAVTADFHRLFIDAGYGDDTINVQADLDDPAPNGLGGITAVFDGQLGADRLNIYDQDNEPDADLWTVTKQTIKKGPTAAPTVNYTYFAMTSIQLVGSSSPGTYNVDLTGGAVTQSTTIAGGAGVDVMNVINAGGPLVLSGNGSADTFNLNEGVATIRGGVGLDNAYVNQDETGTAGAIFDVADDLDALQIFSNGSGSIIGSTAALAVNSFGTIRGSFDLTDRYMIIRSPVTSFLVDKIKRGYNNGAWNGVPATAPNGVITSSNARYSPLTDGIGYGAVGAAAGALDLTTYGAFSVASGNLIITYTLSGDANLDRKVDFNDLVAVSQNYNLANRSWTQGDFTYDGATNFSDLVPLSQNFNTSLPAARSVADDVLTEKRRAL